MSIKLFDINTKHICMDYIDNNYDFFNNISNINNITPWANNLKLINNNNYNTYYNILLNNQINPFNDTDNIVKLWNNYY